MDVLLAAIPVVGLVLVFVVLAIRSGKSAEEYRKFKQRTGGLTVYRDAAPGTPWMTRDGLPDYQDYLGSSNPADNHDSGDSGGGDGGCDGGGDGGCD